MNQIPAASTLVALLAALLLGACAGDEDSVTLGGSQAPGGDLAGLQRDTGVSWTVIRDPATRTARFAYPNQPTAALREEDIAGFLARYPDVFGVPSAADLSVTRREVDEDADLHVRFAQTVDDQPLADVVIDVHLAADGSVVAVQGPFYPELAELLAAPRIAPELAVERALAFDPDTSVGSAAPVLGITVDPISGVPAVTYEVSTESATGMHGVLVRAADGIAFRTLDRSGEAFAAGGPGTDGQKLGFAVDAPQDGRYWLRGHLTSTLLQEVREAPSGFDIMRGCPRGDGQRHGVVFSTTDPSRWEDDAPALKKGQAVDIMAKMQYTILYYSEKFGFASYDGKGSPVISYVYAPLDNGGVQAKKMDCGGKTVFVFSQNAPGQWPATMMDTAGHEFTHAVTASTSRLAYQDESGGLNEALSDIFGQMAENYAGKFNAKYKSANAACTGDEFDGHCYGRSLKNPKYLGAGYCDDYAEVKAKLGGGDNGGVHTTSSVANLAWYLMTFGGVHPSNGRKVPGPPLGLDRSNKLWWQLQRYFLAPHSTFPDAARHSIRIAFQKKLPVKPVACAWYAVGVLDAEEIRAQGVECNAAEGAADSCSGVADGLHCSAIDPAAAFWCRAGSFVGAEYCTEHRRCTGTANNQLACGS